MSKRAAEEMTPSLESTRTGPDFFGYYRTQVEELLSQEEKIPHHKHVDTKKSSTEIIGAELSDLKNEKLNALLRQCVRDSIPEVDEMQSRVDSMLLMSQLSNKKPSTLPTNAESVIPEDPSFKEVEDDLQLLMKSDPALVKEIVGKHSSDLLARLNETQQQLEKLLDNVVTTCSLINRPMSRGEKRDLQKSIKELPAKNLERVAGIIKNHYVALGKEMPDDVFVINMEEEDNILLWRLHYFVAAVKSARKLAS
ncbi:NET domain [Arabidopsis suecica]|uniref:NET domain n=1 Tax=Arabidopsis suecica TaxID=45249 RepID=A0A8T1YRP9_ARASU|nr:NET domain [Arabidopsis suecica]